MTISLNPYLSFPGTARDAMTFYESIFGGELTMATFGEFHAADGMPEFEDKIMHAYLKTEAGFDFMAADIPPGMERADGGRVTMAITARSADEEVVRGYFDKLADGGTITQPIEKQIWGDLYGGLTDKFGIDWMVNCGDSE